MLLVSKSNQLSSSSHKSLNSLVSLNLKLKNNWFRKGLYEVFVRDQSNRFPGLDGLRAIAILLVIVFHGFFFTQYAFQERHQFPKFVENIPNALTWVWQGDKGVDVFFVLSGFLMGWMLSGEYIRTGQLRWRQFYIRRWARIYPAYILALLIFIPSGNNVEYFWANLIPVNNIISLENIYIPWSWSLTIELQFYLLCPLLVYVMNRYRISCLAVLGLVVLSVTFRGHILLKHPEFYQRSVLDLYLTQDLEGVLSYMTALYTNFLVRCPPLLCGLFLGHFVRAYPERLQRWLNYSWIQQILGLFALVTLAVIFSYESYVPSNNNPGWSNEANFHFILFGRPLTGITVTIIVALMITSIRFRWLHHLLGYKAWFPIAQVSYSMYLFHPPFLFLSFRLLLGPEKISVISYSEVFAIICLGTILCFVFGCLTFILLERPCMKWIQKCMSSNPSCSVLEKSSTKLDETKVG